MPEFEEIPVPAIVTEFEDWLNKKTADPGLTVGDFDNMFQVIYFRLRSLYTVEDMHQRLHSLMSQGEHMLSTPGFLEGEDGEPSTPILRENFADTADEEYYEMLNDMHGEVSDEDIAALLEQETE